jgi:hypothetical protein
MSQVENAVRQQLGNLQDNLYRYKMQQKADPDWRTGNDEPIGDVIASIEAQITELRRDADRYGVKV